MATPARLVLDGVRQYGRFDQRVQDTNPLDAYTGLSRRWHAFRLKKWVGFTLIHPEISSAMIIQDVQYLASTELYVRDRGTGVLTEKKATFKGRTPQLPDVLWGATCGASKPGHLLRYDFDEAAGTIAITIDTEPDKHGPAVTAHLVAYVAGAAPALSISARIDTHIDFYTFKQPFGVEGTITAGDRTYTFDRDRDFAIIDENRSFFPYRTGWTWGTFAGHVAGGIVGSSFVDRPELSDADDESTNWVPGASAAEPLAGIEFRFASPDPMAIARVHDRDGRLDLTFTPASRKDVKVDLVAAAIEYLQLGGTYSGSVTSLSGQTTSFDGIPGVLERMKTRF